MIYLSSSKKVLLAIANTVKDESHLVKALNFSKLVQNEKYETQISGSLDGSDFNLACASDDHMKQVKGAVNIASYPEMSFTMQLDKENLKGKAFEGSLLINSEPSFDKLSYTSSLFA